MARRRLGSARDARPAEVRNPAPRVRDRLGRTARLVYGAIAAVGLISLVAGTVYVVKVEPWVKDRLVGESRLAVETLTQTRFTPLGTVHSGIYLFPRDGAAVSDVPADTLPRAKVPAYDSWAEGAGGVPAYTVSYRVVIRAVSDPPVLINGIRVNVVSRAEPPTGWFRIPDVGCGTQPVRRLTVDLDRDPVRPQFFEVDEATGLEKPGRSDITLRVSPADPEVLEVNASARRDDVRFTITLLYQSESGSGEYVIGADEPLRVTGLRPGGAEAYDLAATEDALVRQPDRDPSPAGALLLC